MKILIIKPSSFGDIVQSNPTLTALKEAYPQAVFSWLVFDSFEDMIPLFPDVNRGIVWRKKGGVREFWRIVKAVRAERFDLVIDLQGLARTALITFLSGAKKKIGAPGMKELSWLLVKQAFPKSRTMHAVNRSLETVRYLTGELPAARFNISVPSAVTDDVKEMLLRFEVAAHDRVIGIVPMARGMHKVWPVEHYRELVGRIVESFPGMKIIILGTLEDVRLVRHQCAIDLSGRTTLLQLAGIIQRCDAVIGADTGPVHLASVLDVPTVAIFGGSDVRETSPVGRRTKVLKKEYACSPCRGRGKCKGYPCLSDITAEEVFEALRELLAQA